MRSAWFHCFAGIAGDMALGSLLDAGAPVGEVAALLEGLGVPGLHLKSERVLRAGLSSTRALVEVDEDGVSRTFGDIVEIVGSAALAPRVTARALAVFGRLAEVEGALHGVDPKEIHFHEVGGHDAIADVVGTAIALELLGIDEVFAGPIATGTGTINSAHGLLPNPAPAVLALLREAPLYGRPVGLELTTPTGAALLAALASGFGPMPALTIEATGYGAGGRDLDGLPNVTQVVIGTADAAAPRAGQPLVHLEVNLDDLSGEHLADAATALLEAGALDVWITPVVMKKGRPGHLLSLLSEATKAPQLRRLLLAETGSFGARQHLVERFAERRSVSEVTVRGEIVRVKSAAGRAKVEHDDALAAARRLALTVAQVTSLAEEAFRQAQDSPPD